MGKSVVAKSGIPSDRYHVGKLVLQGLKDDPNFVLQIDGATGKSETSASVLERSVRCAIAFQDLGLKHGDVIVLMAPNHLHLAIPLYAALYLGIIVAAIDRTLSLREIQDALKTTQPKLVFCQSEKSAHVQEGIQNLQLDCKVITFDKGQQSTFTELLEKCKDVNINNFKPTDFDTAESIALLTSTSGSTGLPKAATLTHKNLLVAIAMSGTRTSKSNPSMNLVLSPLQWMSAGHAFTLSPILRFTRLQTSLPTTPRHVFELINNYKPSVTMVSPPFMTTLIKHSQQEHCDFSCFKTVFVGGSVAHKELKKEMKMLMPNAHIFCVYGMSEATSMVFDIKDAPSDSVGRRTELFEYRLVDIETQTDIEEPNKPGELWLKGPSVFKGYYNNPEATKNALTVEGWLKTGDIFYRDEQWCYYFVDRLKQLLKYKGHQISPTELEMVIHEHSGVLDAVVTGVPDRECGDLAVACVMRRPGSHVTAQEIKDLVKDTLSDSKQLRGGVVFLDELPVTATSKVDRMKIKSLVNELKRD